MTEQERPRYMISIAAELVGMHPQTLRIYEQKGLVRPKRTPGNTRLYSERDLERLREIQRLTSELGLNLAGVERVLHLEDELQRLRAHLDRMEREIRAAISQVPPPYKRELAGYRPAQPPERRSCGGTVSFGRERARRRSPPSRSWCAAPGAPSSI